MASASEAAPQGVLNADALKFNDEVIDMLMLLDYETQFCNKELKPIPRTFFVYPYANTAYQFRYFTQLVGWCFKLLKREPDWDEYDDPNTVITNITVMLKNMNIQVNAVPGKLKAGFGDSVCQLLCDLCHEVLRQLGFEYSTPIYPDEGLADEAEVDSDAEINSVAEDDMANDQEEDDLMYQEDEIKKAADSDDEKQVLEATVDPKEWLLEVERVTPNLKIQMPNDSKEWRTHLQQSKEKKQVIEAQFPAAKVQLEKLSKDLSTALERIRNKETFINEKFDERALDHRNQQAELSKVQTEYTELNQVVMDLQIRLKNVTEDLDAVKTEMEERSTTVTDTAPIVKMKDAFKRLRADTRQLEVRIGVVSHTLMQAKLRQRPQETGRMYGGGPGGENNDDYDDAE
mmetsp:Transcript_27077/g.62617  ORF Transcript_27077/g.62617 Transcript_27077/m.62617 type:complete len:402 (+) Transcript_27077:57-1262(+)